MSPERFVAKGFLHPKYGRVVPSPRLPPPSQSCLSPHRSMELWQQLGFKSFGDWRRASERARKAEKKKAAANQMGGCRKHFTGNATWVGDISPSRDF